MMTEQMVSAESYRRLESEMQRIRHERMTIQRITLERPDGVELVLQVVDVLHTPAGVIIKTR